MSYDLPLFDGITYDHERDFERLSGQLGRVFTLMADGRWRSLEDISRHCGGTVASVSARLRDLRKPKFGGYRVDRKYVDNGLFYYRLCTES